MPKVELREATWRDFNVVHALEKACFDVDAWPWFDVLAALTFPNTVRILALLADEPLGFVIGDRRRRKDLGWIATIGVHPNLRRRGIGGILLRACEEALATKCIRLTLRPSNLIAMRLYQKAGYDQVDIWKRYYRNGEDAIVMEKVRDLKG